MEARTYTKESTNLGKYIVNLNIAICIRVVNMIFLF